MKTIFRAGYVWVSPIKIAQQVHKTHGVPGRKGCYWMCNQLNTQIYMHINARHNIRAHKNPINSHHKHCVLGLKKSPFTVAKFWWVLIFPLRFYLLWDLAGKRIRQRFSCLIQLSKYCFTETKTNRMSVGVKEEPCSLLNALGKNWLVPVAVNWILEEGYWSVTSFERNKWTGN